MLNIMAAFAQYERDLIRERTLAGMEEAKRQGKVLGNPTELVGEKKLKMLMDIWDLSLTNKQIAARSGYRSTATQVHHFKGEKKRAKAASKEGPTVFKQKRMARFKEVARQEGVSIRRLNEIIKTRETYH